MIFLEKTTEKELLNLVLEKDIREKEVVLILIAEKSNINIDKLVTNLNEKNIPFFGAVFPGLIYKNEYYFEGVFFTVLPVVEKPYELKSCAGIQFDPVLVEIFIKLIKEKYRVA